MQLVLYDIEPFKAFFDLIFDSANEVELKMTEDNLTIQLLNRSHICFYGGEFTKDFFDTYTVDGAESVMVFVEDLYNILKSANKDDVLTLESNENYLICILEHDFNRRVFELPLSDLSYTTQAPPSIEYQDSFFLKLNELKNPLYDLDKICKTDRFKMITKDNTLYIVSPPDSPTKYSQSITIDSNFEATVTVDKKYIQEILKLSKINNEVEFRIGSDMPVTYVVSSAMDDVKVTCLIAPVIEQEE